MSERACEECGGPVDEGSSCPACATQIRAETETAGATPTLEIPGYRILRELGAGGMGSVLLAEDITLGRRVAVKVVSSRIAGDEDSRQRFLREARTLATIEHPRVVRVYSFGESAGSAYLVMEFVDGETLADVIARTPSMAVDRALRTIRQIVDGLEAAWERQIVHRDIKPSNVLIDRRGEVRVADFGLAKPASGSQDAGLTQSGLMLGTPHYVSPEQAQGKDVDFRADIYSLGIVLFQLLTGSRPFEGTTPLAIVAKHLSEPLPSLRSRRADVPIEVERLVAWMTAKDPAARPASYGELLDAVDACLAGTPTAMKIPVPSPAQREPQAVWLRRLIATGLIATTIALLMVTLQVRKRQIQKRHAVTVASDDRFAIAVAPFYGPDPDSVKEGRVMAALIEQEVGRRLGTSVRVLGIEETKSVIKSHDAARELGRQLSANAVIWGEAFALRNETEIQPHVTMIDTRTDAKSEGMAEDAADQNRAALGETDSGSTIRLESSAPNQIELRKTSAAGIGDLALTLAGIHALQSDRPDRALAIFEQAPPTAETLRNRAQALVGLQRSTEALEAVDEALRAEPAHAGALAMRADLLMIAGHVADAAAAYQKAAAVGQPYVTTRGFFMSGLLYVIESYRSIRYGEHDTLYLLALDPTSLKVRDRLLLPGNARRFAVDGKRVTITCQSGRARSDTTDMTFVDGKLDRPVWLTPRFDLRTFSLKAGRLAAANFMSDFESRGSGPAVHLSKGTTVNPDAPGSLEQLEAELRKEIDRDPTQPWHRFFLLMTLRNMGRTAESNDEFEALMRGEYPAIPYYEFGQMTTFLERMGEASLADRMYAKALQQRKRVLFPVSFATSYERIYAARFVTLSQADPKRKYLMLQRARALTGFILEGEDVASRLWSRWLHLHGDDAASRKEAAEARVLGAQRFNFLALGTRLDLAVTFLIAAAFAYIVVLIGSVVRAIQSARAMARAGVSDESWIGRAWRRVVEFVGLSPSIVMILLIAIVVFVTAMVTEGAVFNPFTVTAMFLVTPALLLRLFGLSVRRVAVSVPSSTRVALFVSYAVVFASAIAALVVFTAFMRTLVVPFALGDSFGHPVVVNDFEHRLEEAPGDDIRYVTAVANHYAGNYARAAQLYERVAAREGLASNLAAVQAHAGPVRAVTSDDVYRAYIGSVWSRLADAVGQDETQSLIVLLFLLVVPLAPLVAFRPVATGDEQSSVGFRRLLALFTPGLGWAEGGAPWFGWLAALSFAIALPPMKSAVRGDEYWSGVARWLVSFEDEHLPSMLGLPPSSGSFVDRFASGLAYPDARWWYSIFTIAAVLFVILHVGGIARAFGHREHAKDSHDDVTALMER
jgi:serine/threonine protein kinase/tetratricopeptide (TPR) repeat protein